MPLFLYIWTYLYDFILFSLPYFLFDLFYFSYLCWRIKLFSSLLFLFCFRNYSLYVYISVVIFKFLAPTVTYIVFLQILKSFNIPSFLQCKKKILECSTVHWISTSYYPCYCLKLNCSSQYKKNLCSLVGTRYNFLHPPF